MNELIDQIREALKDIKCRAHHPDYDGCYDDAIDALASLDLLEAMLKPSEDALEFAYEIYRALTVPTWDKKTEESSDQTAISLIAARDARVRSESLQEAADMAIGHLQKLSNGDQKAWHWTEGIDLRAAITGSEAKG